jgi:hypothetical protein
MSTELVKQPSQQAEVFNFFNQEQFATMQRLCMMFANSELVPDMYKISATNPKEKAIANNMIALEMAQRIGASPLMVMQNLYIVYGRPGWSSKFLIATVNTCGRFEPIKYRMENLGKISFNGAQIDNIQCVAYTAEKGSDEVLESSPVTIKMAIEEGWYGKKGSKWPAMPVKMLRYRSASFWTNEYAPEISMGMHTADELSDIEEIPYEDVSVKVRQEVGDKANGEEIKMPDEPVIVADKTAGEGKQDEAGSNDSKQEGQGTIKGPGF